MQPEPVLELPRDTRAAPPADDRVAVALRGFGPLGILAILVILAGNLVVAPLGAVLVLLWARRSGTPWRAIGYVRPQSWTRTYLFERFGKLLGPGVRAKAVIVLLTAVGFGLLHYPEQGLAGAEQATIVGLVFGTIFAVTGRLWMLMIAHAAFDLTALAVIYWDLEAYVAHLIFK